MKLNIELAHKLWSALCRFGLCCFGPGSFRPNLDSNFVFLLFINLYRYGRVGQYECVRVLRGGFREIGCGGMWWGGVWWGWIGWVDIYKV